MSCGWKGSFLFGALCSECVGQREVKEHLFTAWCEKSERAFAKSERIKKQHIEMQHAKDRQWREEMMREKSEMEERVRERRQRAEEAARRRYGDDRRRRDENRERTSKEHENGERGRGVHGEERDHAARKKKAEWIKRWNDGEEERQRKVYAAEQRAETMRRDAEKAREKEKSRICARRIKPRKDKHERLRRCLRRVKMRE